QDRPYRPTAPQTSSSCLETPFDQLIDCAPAVRLQDAGASARDVRMRNGRPLAAGATVPCRSVPGEPGVLSLVEDVQRLVAEFRELGAPARPAAHGAIVLNGADDVDLLAVVHLIPDGLEDLPNRRRVLCVAPVHQAADVLEADVARRELLVIEDAESARAGDVVARETEVHFFDAVTLGGLAEGLLGARRAARKQDAVR